MSLCSVWGLLWVAIFMHNVYVASPFLWSYLRPFSSIQFDSDVSTVLNLVTSEEDPFSFSLSALAMKIRDEENFRQYAGDRLESVTKHIKPLYAQSFDTDSNDITEVNVDISTDNSIIQDLENSTNLNEDSILSVGSTSPENDAPLNNEFVIEEFSDESIQHQIAPESVDVIENEAGHGTVVDSDSDSESFESDNEVELATPQQEKDSGDSSVDPTFITLRGLGYSRGEIAALRESVKRLLAEQAVERPMAGDLPQEWLKRPLNDRPLYNKASVSTVSSKRVETKSKEQQVASAIRGQFSFKNSRSDSISSSASNSRQGQSPNSNRNINPSARRSTNNADPKFPNRGQEIRVSKWQGVQPIDVSPADDQDQETTSSRARSSKAIEVDDSSYEPISFWADRNEFQDMLLQESRWRVNLLGSWIAPAVRAETKWRMSLYDGWLNLLEEGSGDLFDVEEENEDSDEENISKPYRSSSNVKKRPSSNRLQSQTIFDRLEQEEEKAKLYEEQLERVRSEAVVELKRRLRPQSMWQDDEDEEEETNSKVILPIDKNSWFGDDDIDSYDNGDGEEDDEVENENGVKMRGTRDYENVRFKRGTNSESVSDRNQFWDNQVTGSRISSSSRSRKEGNYMADDDVPLSIESKKQILRERQAKLREELFQQQRQQENVERKQRSLRLDQKLQDLQIDIDGDSDVRSRVSSRRTVKSVSRDDRDDF